MSMGKLSGDCVGDSRWVTMEGTGYYGKKAATSSLGQFARHGRPPAQVMACRWQIPLLGPSYEYVQSR